MSEQSNDVIAGLLLAAGKGSRLGRPKALVEIGGRRLVDRGVGLLRAGGCEPVVVVLGAAEVGVLDAVVVTNPAWPTGMGSSLRAGLAALPDDVTAAVVALVDQPEVGADAVRRVVSAYRAGAVAAVATYGGQRGNPVLLARSVWPEVVRLAVGDVGARPFLAAHPEMVTLVPCDGTGRPDDIDTPGQLGAAADRLQ